MARRTAVHQMMITTIKTTLAIALSIAFFSSIATAEALHELSVEGWKELREVERYQMQIAEKYYRDQDWKVAAAEYEKYLSLYEESSGAPHAQLRWSLAQVQLRKQNTAIKEGFQSVIDYWPESTQAIAAKYYLGRTQKEIGRVADAKKTLRALVKQHPAHQAAVQAIVELIDISTIENDIPSRVEFWKKLTFDTPRNRDTENICVQASRQLASHQFRETAFDEGVKALATTYDVKRLPMEVAAYAREPISQQMQADETKAKGLKLAQQAIAYLKRTTAIDESTPEGKAEAKQLAQAIIDMLVASRQATEVPPAYEAMLTKFGPDDEVLGRLAQWYKSQDDWEKARSTYRRYKSAVDGLLNVAYSYREQQNNEQAIVTYGQAIAADPSQSKRVKPELAITYRHVQKWAEAVATYEQLITEDIEQANRWRWEIATTYKDSGQHQLAIGNFRQCTNFPENYKQMAWCHRQLKQPQEAITLYSQVASDAGSAPWALLQIAYTREEAGQTEPAIQAFQLVCKKYPKDQHASQAHAHLQTKYKISVTLGGAVDE